MKIICIIVLVVLSLFVLLLLSAVALYYLIIGLGTAISHTRHQDDYTEQKTPESSSDDNNGIYKENNIILKNLFRPISE